jgi:hypothetical protein
LQCQIVRYALGRLRGVSLCYLILGEESYGSKVSTSITPMSR